MLYHRPTRACKPDLRHRLQPSLVCLLISKRYGLAPETAATIATITEVHGGPFSGTHVRYVVLSPILIEAKGEFEGVAA